MVQVHFLGSRDKSEQREDTLEGVQRIDRTSLCTREGKYIGTREDLFVETQFL